MPIDMTAAAYVLESVLKPLGDNAPAVRRLLLDYKIRGGRDRHQEIVTALPKDAPDDALIETAIAFLHQREDKTVAVSAITELCRNGDFRHVYLAPGFLEESMRESGLPVPADMKAYMLARGWRPLNWDELCRYWESHK